MSINDIIRYVRETPGNTNPAVVGSMVNAEMNSTLKAAKEYTDSQRLGYTETVKKTITWDGNTEGKLAIPAGNMTAYKVSDTPIKITQENIKRIQFANDSVKIDGYEVQSQTAENGATMSVVIGIIGMAAGQLAAVAYDDIYVDGDLIIEKGVYFCMGYDGKDYISLLEIEEEVIHKVDPKYLPEGGVGYKEKMIITWDGDTTGKTTIPGSIGYACKISDDPIDISNLTLKKIAITQKQIIDNVSAEGYFDIEKMEISEIPEAGIWGVNFNDPDGPFYSETAIMSVKEDMDAFQKGVYLFYYETGSDTYPIHFYVSCVEFEKIRQIDRKFIPGLIPVIELTTPLTIDEPPVTLTEEENMALDSAAKTEMPIVLKAIINGVMSAMVFAFTKSPDGDNYALISNGNVCLIQRHSNDWTAVYMTI